MTTTLPLFDDEPKASGPVECLGQTFPSDEARREHYLVILRAKLKDPAFRKIDGFPIGTDEDILALSDPPYYTACPNPFIEDFITHYGIPYDPAVPYSKEPYVADVSEGKNDPIYNAHSYHTKVPHKAIMRYILHYTQPGDLVFDGFCGTGMTGVAAQLCGDRSVVESLGYRVEPDGTIMEQEQQPEHGRASWKPFSKLGARRAILNDLSPAATFIAHNYNTPLDVHAFSKEATRIMAAVEAECGWMYETVHYDKRTKGRINYAVWSDVFICPQCAGELIFWDVAVDMDAGRVRDQFPCPHCSIELTKRNVEHAWVTSFDPTLQQTIKQAKQVLSYINYSVGNKRYEKKPDTFDLSLIKNIETTQAPKWFPTDRLIEGGESRRNDPIGITHVHHFYTKRNLLVLSSLRSHDIRMWAPFSALTPRATKMHRIAASRIGGDKKGVGGATVGVISGTLYVPSISVEMNVLDQAVERIKVFKKSTFTSKPKLISTQSASHLSRSARDAVDYIFVDPPFGSNISYSELSFLWESWLRVYTDNRTEAIESRAQNKSLSDYRRLMTNGFIDAFRILKPGRWMTIEFSNTQASVWNAIQTALQEAGFVVANVSALDKKQGGFKAVTTTTAVKQDLVISAYKPNGGLEDRFAKSGGGEESAWDFVRSHLRYLPTVKLHDGQLQQVVEREPRIIFDRLVAWFVRHNYPVPFSSQEFQAGLAQRFAERDGMVFLPEQVTEYDKKRLQVARAPQMELFIADERSAIDWLSDFLKKRPSTYQEVHPEFIKQLGAGWKKHETKPELSDLLEVNFLCYDSKSKDGHEVPSQIHGYLSTNWPDLRNLDKSDPRLKAKAAGRWYVPDPNKARDLEMIREKVLLKEFETYRAHTGRRLKVFRLEAMRAGFRHAWTNKDYATIISVARKIPELALQEDEKLLLWYDQALTLSDAQS